MTSQPLATADDVADLVGAHPQWLPGGQGPLRVSLLGQGESYTAWLAQRGESAADGSRVVVRVPRRTDEPPRAMGQEFTALSLVPTGLGPRPVALQEPSAADPTSYMVVSFVPGEILPPERWTGVQVAAHARQLARLHAADFPGHGAVTDAPEALTPRMSILEQADAAMDWWQESGQLAEQGEVAALWTGVRRLLAGAEPAFAELDRYSLVHGDACVVNILVDDGVPRYVDWEYAAVGDPARDLAYLGGEVWAAPWYLDLAPERVSAYLDAYAAAVAERTGRQPDRAALDVRRRAWLVYETFFVTLHFRRLADRAAYAEVIADLSARLAALSARG